MSSKVSISGLSAANFLGETELAPQPLALEIPARQRAILQIVKGNPGLTISDIEDHLNRLGMKAARHTIRSDLLELEREREVYSHQARDRSPILFFPNGRLIHPLLKVSRDLRGITYQATVQESKRGPAIQVQERSFSIINGEKVEGAIFVEYAVIDDFISLLQDIKNRFEAHQETKQ